MKPGLPCFHDPKHWQTSALVEKTIGNMLSTRNQYASYGSNMDIIWTLYGHTMKIIWTQYGYNMDNLLIILI